MRWRLLRRCLLFTVLGLVTAVAVAWGVAIRRQFPPHYEEHRATGVAVVDEVLIRVSIWGGFGWRAEEWLIEDTTLESESSALAAETAARVMEIGPEAFEREESELLGGIEVPKRRVDRLASRGPPVRNIASGGTAFVREACGLPLPALAMTVRGDYVETPLSARASVPAFSFTESARHVVEIPVTLGSRAGRSGPIRLPIEPRPGLLLNTIFYALLWAILLLAPGALRRRIRRARGRCPRCGYSLRGQPEPGCPECGHGREAPAAALAGM